MSLSVQNWSFVSLDDVMLYVEASRKQSLTAETIRQDQRQKASSEKISVAEQYTSQNQGTNLKLIGCHASL